MVSLTTRLFLGAEHLFRSGFSSICTASTMRVAIETFLLIAVCVVNSQDTDIRYVNAFCNAIGQHNVVDTISKYPDILCYWICTEDNDFKVQYYWGLREEGVVKLYYKRRKNDWPRQPYYCYGVLINWKQAIVPCSCVAYTNDKEMSTPWFQASHSTEVKAISPSDIRVGLMSKEHSTAERTNQVGVQTITLHPKCKATFQVDYALLVLQKKLEKSRLVWVNSPHQEELRKQIDRVSIVSAIGGSCLVLRWTESIPEPGGRLTWEVQQSNVKFQHWNMCVPLICPQYMKDGKTKYKPKNVRDCLNKAEGTRYCLTWVQEVSLCNLVPGTPVFCDVGDIRGVMGLVTNFTSWCPYSNFFNGIMGAFDDAMEIALDHLKVRNSEFFSKLHFD